jgi:general secretion pathway protein K
VKRRQRGVALLTAILVVAIATLAATAVLSSSEAALVRTAGLRDTEQAWWYAQGVESWVLGILQKDALDTKLDSLDEPWAIPVTALPVDEGSACGQIVDLQGRFNLNNLATVASPDVYGEQFKRLLAALPEVEVPQNLLPAVRGWMGVQEQGHDAAADDLTYLGLTPPYRAAGRPFTVVSELLAVEGMTPKLYRALAPYVVALPSTNSRINVNTALEPILRALSVAPDGAKLQQFLDTRLKQPATSPDDAIARSMFGADVKKEMVSGGTNFFMLQGDVSVGSGHLALYSLIYRPDSGVPVVLSRSTVPELPGTPPCATPSTSS